MLRKGEGMSGKGKRAYREGRDRGSNADNGG